MKKIIMLGITGIFLTAFVLVMQGRENSALQMSELFNDSISAVDSGAKEKSSGPEVKKEVQKSPQFKRSAEITPKIKTPAARNEAIRKALKIESAEEKRAEVKKILIEYRENWSVGQNDRANSWDPYGERYDLQRGKNRFRYNDKDDDDDNDDDD